MSPTAADLRKFLTNHFTSDEFTALCYDYFREVYNAFATGMSGGQRIQALIEHVQRREREPELLKILQQERPEQYAKYLAQQSEAPVTTAPRPTSPAVDLSAPRPQPVTNSSRALRVFLCHASSDKPAVRDLYQRLRADGFEPWLDEEDILPGQDWKREIPKAVRESDIVLVCLSKHSINKEGYVQKEIKVALDVAEEKPDDVIFLIPVKLEECDVPERLA
ncbi:MAG: toll/interleukin-1 receptor domain-containing protein, partial [Thermoflexales bacterium]|nr:toll/interleukin-1 receptor domain-containing protein [Thermoflexales bacterium]